MTYGSVLKWRFPFQERIEIRTPGARVLFLSVFVAAFVIFGILFSYNNINDVSDVTSIVLIQNKINSEHTGSQRVLKTLSRLQAETNVADDNNEFYKHVTTGVDNEAAIDEEDEEAESLDWGQEEVDMDLKSSGDGSGFGLSANESGDADVSAVIDWNDPRLDLLHMDRPEFSPRFKNPCWFEPLRTPDPYENNTFATFSPSAKRTLERLGEQWEEQYYLNDVKPTRLRCLPHFIIIGQPKCGSTDLFWKVAKHPDIVTPPIKELHWWSRSRQGRRFQYRKLIPLEDYVDMFDEAGSLILDRANNASLQGAMEPLDQIWPRYPENKGLAEPRYLIPHYIQHFIPDVKLILIVRDPVERMYSDYLYFHSKNKSADDFHEAASKAVSLYSSCVHTYGTRRCAYNNTLANQVRVRLRVGMYSVYMQDWLKLFPRQQFYIMRLEDYTKDPVYHVKQIYKFLSIRPIPRDKEKLISSSPKSNIRKPEDQELGAMHNKTRQLLADFYSTYNKDLAALIEDRRYLWLDS
ncbi:CHSTF-like protein [Mya arenaria]|uniref:CHSTF-like protein n=1 Tax=Mya arenaria TaxID=6604 RepID=A0ABY7FF59_MYAAR|nr:CHSTF-like protein [Mya arenaria]